METSTNKLTIRSLLCSVLLFISLLSSSNVLSQTLSGRVVDDKNVPIPFATIYVKELTLATYSNEDGVFEIKIPNGTYTLVLQHLSYQTVTQNIVIPHSEPLKIQLFTQQIQLNQSLISSKNEDPAYAIMRKAIAAAPNYYQQLSSYKAKVYIRGSVVIDKISGMVKMMGGKEFKQLGIKDGDTYLQEAVSEIEFKQGKQTQRVLSETNTFPKSIDAENNLRMGMISYNIYDPEPGSSISPLAPQAFTYYRFAYQGFYLENNVVINKIKVSPRNQSKQAWSGYLYIADDKWYVSKYELSSQQMGVQSTISQNYHEQLEGIWIPINFSMQANVNMMGNRGKLNYVNSIKYEDIVVNPTKTKQANASMQENTKINDLQKQLDKVATKEQFSNRDAYKSAQLLDKISREKNKLLPDSLQIKRSLNLDENYRYQIDSTARKPYDSTFWASIRPIPLLAEEVVSYHIKDSITKTQTDTVRQKPKYRGSYISGKMFKIDSTCGIFYSGLIPTSLHLGGYNAVDGIRYLQSVSLYKHFADSTDLEIGLRGGYAFARKSALMHFNIKHHVQPEKRSYWSLDATYDSKDFNADAHNGFDNMSWTLFAKQNYAHYYQQAQIAFRYVREPMNGLEYQVGLAYGKQTRLENNSDFSFFYKDRVLMDNNPQHTALATQSSIFDDNQSANIELSFSYTPQMRYYIHKKRKRNIGSPYPTLGFGIKKAIPNVFGSNSNYTLLQANVQQKIKRGLSTIGYRVNGAWFAQNNHLHFSELIHFATKPYYLSTSSYLSSFNLVPQYAFDETKWSVSAQVHYASPYILLKYLPLLNASNIREQVQIQVLKTSQVNYTQASYNLIDIFLLGELGVFVGFHEWEYQHVGVRCALRFGR